MIHLAALIFILITAPVWLPVLLVLGVLVLPLIIGAVTVGLAYALGAPGIISICIGGVCTGFIGLVFIQD